MTQRRLSLPCGMQLRPAVAAALVLPTWSKGPAPGQGLHRHVSEARRSLSVPSVTGLLSLPVRVEFDIVSVDIVVGIVVIVVVSFLTQKKTSAGDALTRTVLPKAQRHITHSPVQGDPSPLVLARALTPILRRDCSEHKSAGGLPWRT